MTSCNTEQNEQPSEFRYDMGFSAYPVQTPELASNGLSYQDYEWTQAPEVSSATRSMYHIPDSIDSQYGSYMGYPGVHHGDVGIMTTPTYIPAAEMSFSTPLTHVPYTTHENFYHSAYGSISPTSSNGSSGSSGTGNGQKPKRKRVQSVMQRKAANVRERRRMFHLNEAFDELRKRLPAFNYEKRLSRIETLRLAMTYIAFMKDVSDGKEPDNVKLLTVQRKSEQSDVSEDED